MRYVLFDTKYTLSISSVMFVNAEFTRCRIPNRLSADYHFEISKYLPLISELCWKWLSEPLDNQYLVVFVLI